MRNDEHNAHWERSPRHVLSTAGEGQAQEAAVSRDDSTCFIKRAHEHMTSSESPAPCSPGEHFLQGAHCRPCCGQNPWGETDTVVIHIRQSHEVPANLLANPVPALCQACAKGGCKNVHEEREVSGESWGWSSNPTSALELRA